MSQEEIPEKTPREIELEKDIATQIFIMSRCTSDGAYRIYQQHLDEFERELRELRAAQATPIRKIQRDI